MGIGHSPGECSPLHHGEVPTHAWGQNELVLVLIDLVDNVSDGLCIGLEQSIQVRFVWQATLATDWCLCCCIRVWLLML